MKHSYFKLNLILGFALAFMLTTTLPIFAQSVVINEFSAANFSVAQEDWIELYNTTGSNIDLSGYYLSDKEDKPTKWMFPAGSIINANDFLLIYASGKNTVIGTEYHTNFKITQTQNSEGVYFADNNGNIIDNNPIDIPNQADNSQGRTTDGAATWSFFLIPTPGKSNTSPAKLAYAETPNIKPASGGYSGSVDVSIEVADPTLSIYYTTNGNAPTTASTLYTAPFTVNATTVVRAIAVSPNTNIPFSFIETNTYLIDEVHSVKVLSIAGNQVDDLLDGDWLKPFGSFELFDENQIKIAETSGEFNEHGNDSWAYPQRGFDFISRDQFGYDYAVKHKIFKTSNRDKFQRLIIKAAANDNYPFSGGGLDPAHIRDAYVHHLAQVGGMELDCRSYEPCVLYLNGEYWGVYEIREKVDDADFTDYYFDQDEYDIDFIQTWGGTWAAYGDFNDWTSLHNFILTNDMADPANYKYVTDRFNVNSLTDYVILNTQIVCKDWLNWNTAWWHGKKDAGVKWRYALWDMDATFGHYVNYTGIPNEDPDANPCDPVQQLMADPEGHLAMLDALLKNEDFHNTYINRYTNYNNSLFSCEVMLSILDSLVARIEPEMQRHVDKWGGSKAGWMGGVNQLRDFIEKRCFYIDEGIADCFELEGPFDVVVKVVPDGTGTVNISGLDLPNYPWTGQYYGGAPINLTATPKTGFLFQKWESKNNTFTPNNKTNPAGIDILKPDTIIAYFIPDIPVHNITVLVEPVNSGKIDLNGFVFDTYPDGIDLDESTAIDLKALNNAGYTFSYWELKNNTLSPNVNTANVNFTLLASDTIIAHFEQIKHPLYIEVQPPGSGSLSLNGFTPGSFPATQTYTDGLNIALQATPAANYSFANYQLKNHSLSPNNTSSSANFNITQPDTLIANFVKNTGQLTFIVEPANNGKINLNGTLLSNYPHTQAFTFGDAINLTAAPQAYFSFDKWSAAHHSFTPDANNTTTTFNFEKTDTIYAWFTQNQHELVFKVMPDGAGKISLDGTELLFNPDTKIFPEGDLVNISAQAAPKYQFVGWQTAYHTILPNQTAVNANFTVQQPDTLVAEFKESQTCTIAFPAAFTPNNDGVNDVFQLKTACELANFTLQIYDRWGGLVFTTSDPQMGWNGLDQKLLRQTPMGVYSWVCQFDLPNNASPSPGRQTHKGNITLLR
jgi:gliding motility-associated-like protein